MDFELSDDQRALESAARALLESLASRPGDHACGDVQGAVERDWSSIVEQGWLGVLAPEELGGIGLSWVETCVLLEQAGQFASPLPVAPTLLAVDAAVHAGDGQATHRLLAGGRCALVLSTDRSRLEARPMGGGWEISGVSAPVLHLTDASELLCTAGAEGDEHLFLVPVGDGVRIEPLPGVDITRSLGRATVSGATGRLLGGSEEVARLFDRVSLAATADMLGASRRVLQMATDYAKERIQFGRPIGSFQAVKHRLADMLVDVEAVHSLTYWAAWCLSNAPDDERIAAAAARQCALERCPKVTGGGLQVHGGIGFTWEHPLHRYLKRVAVDGQPIGATALAEPMLDRLLVEAFRAGEDVF